MTDASEALKRFERLDEALARDVERRRRLRRVYWLVIAIAVVLLGLILYFTKSAEDIGSDAGTKAGSDAGTKAGTEAGTKAGSEAAVSYVGTQQFIEKLATNPILIDKIGEPSQEIILRLNAIEDQLPDNEEFASKSDLLDLNEAFKIHKQHATSEPRPDNLESRLRAVELRQDTLESGHRTFDTQLQTLQSRQDELEARQEQLEMQYKEPSLQSSFLLKESGTTGLPGRNLTFSLGKRFSDGIEVEILVKGEQVYLSDGKVRFGVSFVFQDLEQTSYRATFTSGQSRFLSRDFVVLDLAVIDQSGGE